MAQAKGSSSQVLLDFETAFGANPTTPAALVVPFVYPFDLAGEEPLAASDVHRNDRNVAQPFYDKHDVKGSPSVPVDLLNFGYWLRLLLGAPETSQPAAVDLNAGAAVDKGGGLVGIPITGHPFQATEPVTIAGTTNYDGSYVVVSETTNEIVITASYTAETFTALETCRSNIYTHVFKPADELESAVVDKGFLNISSFFLYNGVKVSKLSLSVDGNGGDLVAKLDLMGAKETPGSSAYDGSPNELPLSKFQMRQATIKEGGALVATVKTLALDIDNGLDGDTFCVAGGGIRGALNEGDCQPSGTLTAMFTDLNLYNQAVNGTESSLELILTFGLYSLTILVPELLYSRKSPSIVKGGVWLPHGQRARQSELPELEQGRPERGVAGGIGEWELSPISL